MILSPAHLRGASVVIYSAFLSHMFIVTVQGIYYLTERVYARSPETLPDKAADDDSGN
jgi:uncharacterized protein YbcI